MRANRRVRSTRPKDKRTPRKRKLAVPTAIVAYLHSRPASELADPLHPRACRVFPRRRRVNDELFARRTDPDGCEVLLDAGTRRHLMIRRPQLIDHIDAIIDVVNLPDYC
jgi:hypothetical protein